MKQKLFTDSYLKRLIVPLIFEQTLEITVGMADTMMVSSAGEAAVSGVSLVDQVNNLIIAIVSALATGGAVVASQYLGAHEKDNASRSANQLLFTLGTAGIILMIIAIVSALATGGAVVASQYLGAHEKDNASRSANQLLFTLGTAGIILMIIALAFNRPILRLFFGSIDDDVMHNAIVYFVITGLSFPFLAIYNAGAALFRSMGNSRITLRISLIMNIMNIVGNAIGVFVLHLGAAGVAWPSFFSRGVAAGIVTYLLLDQTLDVHYLKERFHIDGNVIRRILYIGIPSGIENGIFELGRVIVVSIIATFGTMQIAANGVANNLDGVGVIIGKAMSLAMITVIGQCVGAKDEEQVRFYTKKLMKITYIGMWAMDIPLLIFLRPILHLYGLSEQTLNLAWLLVMIHDVSAMFIWPLAFVLPNMLRACNDVKFTMTVSLVSMAVNRILFSWIIGAHFGMGAIGVWIAMIIDWICRTIFFVGRYLRGGWKQKMFLNEEKA